MQVFFVSIRTALIYGPGELIEARSVGADQMNLRMIWPIAYDFDDWEGYAVVVPERNEVWGLSHPAPAPEQGELEIEFPFTPQPIPPADRKLFPRYSTPAPAAEEQAADEEVWSFYQEESVGHRSSDSFESSESGYEGFGSQSED